MYPWAPQGMGKGPGSAAYQGLPVLKEQQRLLQTNQVESKELRAGGVSRSEDININISLRPGSEDILERCGWPVKISSPLGSSEHIPSNGLFPSECTCARLQQLTQPSTLWPPEELGLSQFLP